MPLGGAVYERLGFMPRMNDEGETHGEVTPLRADLKGPETPFLTEVRDLIARIVVRPEAVFHGHTRVLWTEADHILRVGPRAK
jgi:hypothetical protein